MKLKESDYKDIEQQLIDYFYTTYFLPIIELFKEPLYNSTNDVINAINRGQIVLQGDEISGVFNIKVSRELSKFATFNKFTHKWKIKDKTLIPKDILGASVITNEKVKRMHERMKSIIDGTANVSKDKIKDVNFDISKQAKEMDAQLEKERIDLGIKYEMNEKIREEMTNIYNENMQLNVRNFDNEQISRLREMIEKNVLEGFNRTKMIDAIQTEFEISKNRAKFISRQETSIFMSELRDLRYKDVGIKFYQFLTSNDIRVRDSHKVMAHRYCTFDDANIYCDSLEDLKKGNWKSRKNIDGVCEHPGFDFGCRCVSKPIIL